MAAKTTNGAPTTVTTTTSATTNNSNANNTTTCGAPVAKKGTTGGGAGETVDGVSPLKMSFITKVRGQHKRSASLPEHILDNVALPLSKLELEKVANAAPGGTAVITGSERVPAASNIYAIEDDPTGSASGVGRHVRTDSTRSVGGITYNGPPGGAGATNGGVRARGESSNHYPKLSWDSTNGGNESGTDLMENGSSDYSNLEVVSADSKIGRLFSKHFPDLCEVPIKHANYSCSLIKDSIPYHGRLYLTPSWICFYSKLFKKQLAIALREVLLIKKEKSAFVVPNAIKVVSSTQKLVFGSLFHRHVTFKLMTVLWSRNCCDRALIDYDQISLDSTAGAGAASALNETEGEEGEGEGEGEMECSGILGDQSNMSDNLCVGSKNAIFSPSHGIEHKQNFEVISSTEEMVSADERTLFFNSPGTVADLVKCSSKSAKLGDHDQPNGDDDDRCSTVVRVNAPIVHSSQPPPRRPLTSSEDLNDNLATLTGAGVEQMSEPYQLTATVRYRPPVSREQHITTSRGLTDILAPLSSVCKSLQQDSNRFTLSSDSGSPQTEARMTRRNNENHHHGQATSKCEKGHSSSRGGNAGGGRSTRSDHLTDQKRMLLQHTNAGTAATGAAAQNSFASVVASNNNRPVIQKESSEIAMSADFVPLCHHCQVRRSENRAVAREGVCLLLFTIVLFFLLMTSLVLIWQLGHLSPHLKLINNLNHHSRPGHHKQTQEEISSSSFSFSSPPSTGGQSQFGLNGGEEEGEYKEQEELMTLKSSSLVQLVLHSCAMRQATSEYLAKTIEANNLLLNNINSQLEKVAHSFGVDQLALEKLVTLMNELKQTNNPLESPSRPTTHPFNASNS